MYSLSIDYLFNRVYDVLLWIKYAWFFTVLRKDPDAYLAEVVYRDWDGLRDRGWFDAYLAQTNGEAFPVEIHTSLWQRMLESIGLKVKDSDGDGIPDVTDSRPFDKDNLTKAELKERYESDYSLWDHIRDAFGIGPVDSDKDGVPDSYETKHGLDKNNPDTDHDGLLDGQELTQGTDPHNPDSDGDLVLDGRDEAPLDSNISSYGSDGDGDGVSDILEKIFGSDILKKDTDGDGIPDNMDTYILDPENIGRITSLDLKSAASNLHFSIQNPALSFFADVISVIAIVGLAVLVYVSFRWFLTFLSGLNHYEHHFHHDDNHGGHGLHIIKHHKENIHEDTFAGIPGLSVTQEIPVSNPSPHDYDDHPKFAIIQGYMSSGSEALWRIGIMEADNLLSEVLRERGYQGEGVGEMLKGASFKTIDLAWDAHRTRNRIAHDGSTFELTEREAKRTFVLYESVFRDLKVVR
jgi:Bacterial TSP3 repeat